MGFLTNQAFKQSSQPNVVKGIGPSVGKQGMLAHYLAAPFPNSMLAGLKGAPSKAHPPGPALFLEADIVVSDTPPSPTQAFACPDRHSLNGSC